MTEVVVANLINLGLSIISGLAIYFSLILIRQRWVITLHHLITYMLLPPIAFVITKVISNNLALSLGMIGALSIIRFRNPVKNPLELIIFFALLTLGISYAVNYRWGILLIFVVISVLITSKILEIIFRKINLLDFSLSFQDSDFANTIEVQSKKPIDFLDDNKSLILSSHIQEPEEVYYYKLTFRDKQKLDANKERIKITRGNKKFRD